MPSAKITRLTDRGVVSVTGSDSEKLLQGLVTNDLELLSGAGTRDAGQHAGLLSPQGKILFEFFVVRTGSGYLLDVAAAKAAELAKRVSMYKLRADVTIADVSAAHAVFAQWGDGDVPGASEDTAFADTRHPSMGLRLIKTASGDSGSASHQEYDAHRVALGVPEGGKDYDFGDAYPHEADFDLFNGVSFTKGCYVGQEIVARMQNKTVVRKRVVKISGSGALTPGADILIGDVPIGRVGTVDGRDALAMLRLDRAVEAQQKGQKLTAGGVEITPDAAALARYSASAASQASPALRT